jgi:hypothetical protein
MVHLSYQPNEQVQFTARYRYESKPINYNPFDLTLNPVVGRPKKALRSQLNYKMSNSVTIRSRFEVLWVDDKGAVPQNGFLTFLDIIFKPALKKFGGNIRLSWFETDGYDSRIYAFENDVLYSYSVPVFFDKGYRYYLNGQYKLSRNFSLWARFAQTIYENKSEIGSGLDLFKGNKKSELKVQIVYGFN